MGMICRVLLTIINVIVDWLAWLFGLMAARHGLYPFIIVRLLPASAVLGKALGMEEQCQLFPPPGLQIVTLLVGKIHMEGVSPRNTLCAGP